MPINYVAVIVCAVLSMVIGFTWYSKALFGNMYAEVMGMNMNISKEEMKAIQKRMMPVYIGQFLLSLFQVFMLALFLKAFGTTPGIKVAFFIFMGFVMTTIAGGALWSGKTRKNSWKMFFIVFGAQFVTFMASGIILSNWH